MSAHTVFELRQYTLRPGQRERLLELGRKGGQELWLTRAGHAPSPLHVAFAAATRGRTSMHSLAPHWRPVAATTARPGCGPSTTTATTAPS